MFELGKFEFSEVPREPVQACNACKVAQVNKMPHVAQETTVALTKVVEKAHIKSALQ